MKQFSTKKGIEVAFALYFLSEKVKPVYLKPSHVHISNWKNLQLLMLWVTKPATVGWLGYSRI